MISVPRSLYSKEITSYLRYLLQDKSASYFSDLDKIHKCKLVGLGIKALGCDIDVILTSLATNNLADFLLHPTEDEKIEVLSSLQESAFDHFSDYFDQMLCEINDEILSERMLEAGFRSTQDSQTGETIWRQSA